MERVFYKSRFISGRRDGPFFLAWVLVLFFSFSLCSAQEPVGKEVVSTQDSNACSVIDGFQETKNEVGYSDPQRYGEGEPENLISWILIGVGIWCVIVIILFALFHKSSIDENWVREQAEQDDFES